MLGAAIGAGPLVPHRPWPMALYVASIAGACFAILALAAMDAWASRQHFARLRSQHLAAQAALARELRANANRRADNPVRQESK